MQTAEIRSEPEFGGSEEDQQIALDLFTAMRGMGRFFSRTAPIRVSVESLSGYMAARRPELDAAQWAARILEVLGKNDAVFEVEEINGQVLAATTAAGVAPSLVNRPDLEHS